MSVSVASSVVTGLSNQHPTGMSTTETKARWALSCRGAESVGREIKAQGAYKFKLPALCWVNKKKTNWKKWAWEMGRIKCYFEGIKGERIPWGIRAWQVNSIAVSLWSERSNRHWIMWKVNEDLEKVRWNAERKQPPSGALNSSACRFCSYVSVLHTYISTLCIRNSPLFISKLCFRASVWVLIINDESVC